MLRRLIEEASAEGLHDSQGVFTVAGDRAQFKLAQAQLPRAEAWILKVVQTAVALGARGIRIQQQRRRTIIRFPVTEETPIEDLLRVLQDPTATIGRAFGHLVVGLRGLAMAGRSFRLYFFDERGLHAVFRGAWGEMVASRASRAARRTVGLELVVDFPIGEAGRTYFGLGSGTRLAVDEAEQLDAYAYCSAIPVVLDGRDIATLEPFVHRRGVSIQTLPILLEGVLPLSPSQASGQPGEGLGIPQSLASKARRFGQNLGTVKAYKTSVKEVPEGRYRALCRVSFHSKKGEGSGSAERTRGVDSRSWCHWMLDGVVLSTEPLPLELGAATLDLFVDASGLPLDLTTFGVVDCEAKRHRLDLALRETAHRSQLWEFDETGLRRNHGGPSGYSAGAFAVGGAMLLNPATAFVGGGLALGSIAAHIGRSRTPHSHSPALIKAAVLGLSEELSKLAASDAQNASATKGTEQE